MLEYGYYNMDCMKGLAEFPDKFLILQSLIHHTG